MSLSACVVDRRGFLKMGAAGATGLLIGFYLPERVEALAAAGAAPEAAVALNAWIHIGTDDQVTILIDKSEMGQSILTGLAMLAAEELECDGPVRTACGQRALFPRGIDVVLVHDDAIVAIPRTTRLVAKGD